MDKFGWTNKHLKNDDTTRLYYNLVSWDLQITKMFAIKSTCFTQGLNL